MFCRRSRAILAEVGLVSCSRVYVANEITNVHVLDLMMKVAVPK